MPDLKIKKLPVIKLSYIMGVFLFISGCSQRPEIKSSNKNIQKIKSFRRNPTKIVKEDNISIAIYDFKNFKPFLNQRNDTVYVINFWATWCTPCVKELPSFNKIQQAYKKEKVKILLVSMDFSDKIKSQLIPFIRKNNLTPEVILLDAPNENSWITEIDSKWSGSVPATLIYKNKKRDFYSKPMTYNSLKTEINRLLIN